MKDHGVLHQIEMIPWPSYFGLTTRCTRCGCTGVMFYKKNRIYEGDWANDVRSGKGYERYSNANKYEGEFQNGKAHGKGVY